MIVVSDTGPIHYLISIAEIELLPKLYGRIFIPPSVRDELRNAAAPEVMRRWIASPPQWLEIRESTRLPDAGLTYLGLGPGERDAILLSEELEADEVMLDDLAGRKEAQRRRLHVIGTLGILRAASIGTRSRRKVPAKV